MLTTPGVYILKFTIFCDGFSLIILNVKPLVHLLHPLRIFNEEFSLSANAMKEQDTIHPLGSRLGSLNRWSCDRDISDSPVSSRKLTIMQPVLPIASFTNPTGKAHWLIYGCSHASYHKDGELLERRLAAILFPHHLMKKTTISTASEAFHNFLSYMLLKTPLHRLERLRIVEKLRKLCFGSVLNR
jgi:hypothetical protein